MFKRQKNDLHYINNSFSVRQIKKSGTKTFQTNVVAIIIIKRRNQ